MCQKEQELKPWQHAIVTTTIWAHCDLKFHFTQCFQSSCFLYVQELFLPIQLLVRRVPHPENPSLVPLQLFPDASCILVSISSLATLLVWHLSLWNTAFACRCACPRGLRGPWGERPFLIICATLSLGTVLWNSRTDSNNSIYSQSHTLLRLMLLSEHSIAPKCLNILTGNCKVKNVQRIKAGDTATLWH